MKKYLLSIDDGGTYIKAAIHDFNGRQIALTRAHSEPLILRPDWTEYDQDRLWEINCGCIRALMRKTAIDPQEIACIGISGQGSGFYAVDAQGESIRNAIASSDGRAKMIAERWNSDGTMDAVYDTVYRCASAGQLNTILAWLKENEPENYGRIAHLFTMKDLLVYRFTGEVISSYGCQSASGLLDMRTRRFTPELARHYGLDGMDERFGPLRWDVEICGSVTAEAAAQCGLVPGIPVSAGSHDVIATAISMGVTDAECCFMITGTHGINGYIADAPVLNRTIGNNEMFAEDGKYLIEEGYPSSSGTLEWAISVLFSDDQRPSGEIYRDINAAVESIEPEANDLIFMPYLRGSRDDAGAEGVWLGLKPYHSRSHLLQALYEGVAYAHRIQMNHLFMNRERPPRIKTAGGATCSSVWMQMFADVLQIPLEIVPDEEMGVKGASIVAAVAAGIYPDLNAAVAQMTEKGVTVYPRAEKMQIYDRKFMRFQKAYDAVRQLWK
ncbi:MAG: FGGY-family carbohydrate kinase [Aristaeellaceae bacterium]